MLKEDLLQVYADCFRKNWELPAISEYFGSETLTYCDLARNIARTHMFFKAVGIKPGDKVALLGKNHIR